MLDLSEWTEFSLRLMEKYAIPRLHMRAWREHPNPTIEERYLTHMANQLFHEGIRQRAQSPHILNDAQQAIEELASRHRAQGYQTMYWDSRLELCKEITQDLTTSHRL